MNAAVCKGDKPGQWFIKDGDTFLSGPYPTREAARSDQRMLKGKGSTAGSTAKTAEGPAVKSPDSPAV